jgi:transposase
MGFTIRNTIINRHVRSAFWSSENDALLRELEAAGLSTNKIAARFGVTRRSVQRRSHYLRGLPFPLPPYQEKLRKKSAKHREQRERRSGAALAAMVAAIARGGPRNEAIIQAMKRGAGAQAIAKELGVSRQLIYRRIWQGATEQELRAIREGRRKEQRHAAAAVIEMRAAIARGMPREAAIIQANNSGATYAAIGKELGLTRQRVHQIVLLET